MAIRLRTIDGIKIAICAARSVPHTGDVYLDDADHHALAQKFIEDFMSEGLITETETGLIDPVAAALREQEETNNPARAWWDSVYVVKL